VITVWLVVTLQLSGQPPILLTDARQPTVAACLARASELMERAAQVRGDDGFEFAAACSIVKSAEEPANSAE
jgi:hypothetical protein